jgi:hypothetical protein
VVYAARSQYPNKIDHAIRLSHQTRSPEDHRHEPTTRHPIQWKRYGILYKAWPPTPPNVMRQVRQLDAQINRLRVQVRRDLVATGPSPASFYPTFLADRLQLDRAVGMRNTYDFKYRIGESDQRIMFPAWMLLIVLCLLPSVWFIRIMRCAKRRHVNHCMRCTYDLTGNKSGVCPECGLPVRTSPLQVTPGQMEA